MVFFTCNNCGESLKKKDVEKHCNTRCRGGPFLTCVDCLKDFREDFVKHTVCVTEDDRYSANGLKGIQTKQKSKQQQWVEVVQETVSKTIDDGVTDLTPSIRNLMLWLQDQPTLPDKAKPFTNFIKNARRSEPPQNIEFVWKILEQARKDLQAKLAAEREAAEAERRKAKQQKLQQKEESSDSSDSDSSDDEKESNSKKNKNHKGPQPEVSNSKVESKKDKKKKRMVSESESVVNGSSEFRKHKKSKKNPEDEIELENTSTLNNAMDACHLTTQDTIDEEKKLSKKEKKEKKKREKYEAEMKAIEATDTTETAEDQGDEQDQTPVEESEEKPEGKKGKKKKNKKKNEEETAAVAEPPQEGKKKKKKNKHETDEPIDGTEKSEKKSKNGVTENGKLNETLNMEDLERTKFSWDQTILQVLESQSDKEISFKKLSKKVCNEYLYSLGDSCHEDEHQIMMKFQKKLHKMHNVLVLKDRVRLKTSRD